MNCVLLYNPLADNKRGKQNAEEAAELFKDSYEISYQDITELSDAYTYIETSKADKLVMVGGDGTLNRFINVIDDRSISRELLYYPAGSGNDFFADVKKDGMLVTLNPYLEDLPSVIVNGREYKFINGVGYGIDGYCCEVGDRLRDRGDHKINYTAIAIKGLLFYFRPPNATVTVDGVEYKYKKVWLAPGMNGRYYGGGMMVAPGRDRLKHDGTLDCVVLHGSGKLKTLMIFPGIFKGEHIKHTKYVDIKTGHEINVKFDRPTALQIDGETIKGVTECTYKANVGVRV